jgi:ribose transport system permease protein
MKNSFSISSLGKNAFERINRFSLLIAFLSICVGIASINPVFLSTENMINILVQATITSIIAFGMTLVIITGGIDLSVGSIVAFTGVILGLVLEKGYSIFLAVIICLISGIIIGFINGALITKWKVPPFIATLGMMSVARGAALTLTQGRSISGFSDSFLSIADKSFFLPIPVGIMIIVFLFTYIFTKYTYWGHYLYAIGGNKRAAWLAGIRIKFYTIVAYSFCGLFSAIGAIILTSRLNSAQPIAGNFYELDTIAAVVIGGASLNGGTGTIIGTFIGALTLTVLKNGMSILNVSSYIQQIIIGSIIIIAVLIDKYKQPNSF